MFLRLAMMETARAKRSPVVVMDAFTVIEACVGRQWDRAVDGKTSTTTKVTKVHEGEMPLGSLRETFCPSWL